MRFFKLEDGESQENMMRCIAGEMINLEAGRKIYEMGVLCENIRPYPIIKNKNCKITPLLNLGTVYTTLDLSMMMGMIADIITDMEPENHLTQSLLFTGSNLFCATKVSSKIPKSTIISSRGVYLNANKRTRILTDVLNMKNLNKCRFLWQFKPIDKLYLDNDVIGRVSSIIYDHNNFQTKKNGYFTMKPPQIKNIISMKNMLEIDCEAPTMINYRYMINCMAFKQKIDFLKTHYWKLYMRINTAIVLSDAYLKDNLYDVKWDDISPHIPKKDVCDICKDPLFGRVFLRFGKYELYIDIGNKQKYDATENNPHCICSNCINLCVILEGPLLRSTHPNSSDKLLKKIKDKTIREFFDALFNGVMTRDSDTEITKIQYPQKEKNYVILHSSRKIPILDAGVVPVLFNMKNATKKNT